MSKKIIILLVVVILFLGLIFFFPKKCGTGLVTTGYSSESCECFGFQKNEPQCVCYGIKYGCKTSCISEACKLKE